MWCMMDSLVGIITVAWVEYFLFVGLKMYMYLEFCGRVLWARYSRLWSLGWMAMLWSYITVNGFA